MQENLPKRRPPAKGPRLTFAASSCQVTVQSNHNPVKVHYLQHVPYEGLGSIEPYLETRRHVLSSTQVYLGQKFPCVESFDWLIVMGGPMGTYNEKDYPWLISEKRLIQNSIDAGKTVLGICLGAQLIAEALGAKITKNRHREIGWFPIYKCADLCDNSIAAVIPETLEAFHWHSDTFSMPAQALPLASSKACLHQGFIFQNRVVGLQFHLEMTWDAARLLIQNCYSESDGGEHVQTTEQMLREKSKFTAANKVMDALLNALERESRHEGNGQL